MLAQRFHVPAMLKCRKAQSDDANYYHQHRILARPQESLARSRLLLLDILKKLVDGETEADQRRRRPDPRHQRAIVSQPRSVSR